MDIDFLPTSKHMVSWEKRDKSRDAHRVGFVADIVLLSLANIPSDAARSSSESAPTRDNENIPALARVSARISKQSTLPALDHGTYAVGDSTAIAHLVGDHNIDAAVMELREE